MKRTVHAYRFTLISLLSFGIIISLSFFFAGKEIFSIFVPEEIANYLSS